MIARRVFYEGRVQGVGFRWTVKRLAQGYEVSGTVQNLPDGRVALLVQGQPAEVTAFLKEIADSELKANIRKADVHESTTDPTLRGFQIVQ